MTQETASGAAGPPSIIYIIRHGEKPPDPPSVAHGAKPPIPAPPFGIDFQGVENDHSLLPRGWQRSGALTDLFDPTLGPLQAGLQTPATLLSPSYGKQGKTIEHRTYQTIQGLASRLGINIVSDFAEKQGPQLAASVVSTCSGIVLICWEHDHIPALASALPTVSGTVIPAPWPDGRFDVIWTFTLVSGSNPTRYTFGQVPQQLLSGDTDTVIS
jgi:hypothetical protein